MLAGVELVGDRDWGEGTGDVGTAWIVKHLGVIRLDLKSNRKPLNRAAMKPDAF